MKALRWGSAALLLCCCCSALFIASASEYNAGADAETAEAKAVSDEFTSSPETIATADGGASGDPGTGSQPSAAPGTDPWGYELAGAIACAIYLLNYIVGTWRNRQIAKAWVRHCHAVFAEQFAQAGPGVESAKEGAFPLHADAADCYTYYATGRRGCESLSATLQLAPRHNLVQTLVDMGFPGQKDALTIEVAMKPDNMEPLVMAVLRKEDMTRAAGDLRLLEFGSLQPIKLPQPLVCVAEHADAASRLLTAAAVAALGECVDLVRLIHITDQNDVPVLGRDAMPRKVLRFILELPPSPAANMAQIAPLMRLPTAFVDALSAFKLTSGARAKSEKKRLDAIKTRVTEQHKENLRRMQELKYKKLQEEREAYGKMTDAQKRKFDEKAEKAAKKSAAKAGPRVKKV
ncbi:hypothetical protein JKP88DRAFT_223569 [Tribonema minus]|uniref:Coiled-coil domain-containing protein 47 n=1 Tax=Tribonema minus TaxID=303371 RepID=A0A835Z0X4_9STRA|nr:hypothetical protein JKP88DRAFT_223569 [Tribonema minus]